MGQTSSTYYEELCNLLNSTAIRLTVALNSAVQFLLGLTCIIMWGVMLDYAWDYKSPIHNGAGIWAGALAMIPGILGIVMSIKSIENRQKLGLFYAHFGISMSIGGTSSQIITNGLKVYRECRKDPFVEVYCESHTDDLVNLGLGSVICAGILIATQAVVLIYYIVVHVKANKACKQYPVDSGGKQNGVKDGAV